MKRLIKKGFLNKRNNQVMISVPRREFKKLNPKSKISKDTLFEVRLFKERGKE